MGVLDHLSDLFGEKVQVPNQRNANYCRFHERVLLCISKAHRVTVVGYVDPSKVVSHITHRTGKKSELWPYVPYDVVDHPYAQGKKSPPGYVRHAHDPHLNHLARASSTEVRYTTAFSNENTGACAIM